MKRKSIATLAVCCVPGIIACSSSEPPDGSVRGELRIANISFTDGHSEREFYLAAEGSDELTRLVFAHDPDVKAQTPVKIWGGMEGENLLVDRLEVDESHPGVTATVEEPLINGVKKTRTVGFVLMDIGNGSNLTNEQAQAAAFGTRGASNASLKEYYLEASYNTLEFTGQVFSAPVEMPDGCSTSALQRIANGWAAQFGQTLDHWMGYIGSRSTECEWGGVGWEGSASRAEKVSFYNASSSCVVLAQEIGHNLGWMHAGTMDCGTSIINDDTSTCSGNEYGSRISPMGGGCLHLNAYDKWYQGFFGGCNGVKTPSSGTFTLLPTELPCDGLQGLQVPMPHARAFRNTSGSRDTMISRYYLELRTKRGLDNKNTIPGPAVFVHVVGDVPQASQTATFSWVLDMNPSTDGFDGMTVGQTFNDPAGGVSFTVTAMDTNGATVNVTVANGTGSPTCMDGSAFTAPGPGISSCSMSTGGMGGMGGMGAGGRGGAGAGGRPAGGAGGVPGGASGMPGGGSGGMAGATTGGASGAAGLGGAGGSDIAGSGGLPAGGAGAGGAPITGGTGASGAPTGAGAPGTGGSVAGAAGMPVATGGSSAAGAGPGPVATEPLAADDGGCGCRTAPSRPASNGAWALGLLALGWLRRRRS